MNVVMSPELLNNYHPEFEEAPSPVELVNNTTLEFKKRSEHIPPYGSPENKELIEIGRAAINQPRAYEVMRIPEVEVIKQNCRIVEFRAAELTPYDMN